MRYKILGSSGLRVSELCLGTMTFGEDWGWGATKAECRKMFDLFVHEGGNFIDTAINYTNGTSEKILGELIGSDRSRLVLATKYTLSYRKDDPNAGGNHRKNLVESVNISLKRLGTDYIDLYWLHMWDFTTPVEEVMRALDDMVRAGKILHIGASDTPAWIVSQANTLAEHRGWSKFVAYQGPYSLANRHVERDVLPLSRHWDLAFTPWAILGGGALTGKYSRQTEEPKRYEKPNERTVNLGTEVEKVAAEIGRPASQVAIAWVLAQRDNQKVNIIPILGARNDNQLRDNLGALDLDLSEDHLKRLHEVSKIELGFPHEFLQQPYIKELIHGETYARLDNHKLTF